MRNTKKQDREEDGDKYRERVAAIQEVLSEHDKKQKETKAMKNRGQKGMDWRSPTDAMRKVCAGLSRLWLPSCLQAQTAIILS